MARVGTRGALTGSDGEWYRAGAMRPRRSRPRAPWRIELERGAAELQRGEREAARASFVRAHGLAPDEPEPALALGREEWRRGRLAEAERLLRVACAARPAWAIAAAALGRVLIERGDLDGAEGALAPARAASPRHAAILAVTGEWHLAAGRATEAAAAFLAAREAGADERVTRAGLARAEHARGLALVAAGRDDEAAFAFKRAADLDGAWAPPRTNLGALLHRLGRPSRARAQYRAALAIAPRDAAANFNLGMLCREQGDLDGAAHAFAAAHPAHPAARREQALALAERGDHARAIALFDDEIAAGSADAALFTNLGIACARSGDPARAQSALEQALALDPHQPRALAHLAEIYARAGRALEAAALLARRELGRPTGV
jgi:Flp pilus assembly protein TadD